MRAFLLVVFAFFLAVNTAVAGERIVTNESMAAGAAARKSLVGCAIDKPSKSGFTKAKLTEIVQEAFAKRHTPIKVFYDVNDRINQTWLTCFIGVESPEGKKPMAVLEKQFTELKSSDIDTVVKAHRSQNMDYPSK